jgi:hypothetical protein
MKKNSGSLNRIISNQKSIRNNMGNNVHIIIKEHKEECELSVRQFWDSKMTGHDFCKMNPQHEVFLLYDRFYLLTYNSCLSRHYNNKHEFIKHFMEVGINAKNLPIRRLKMSVNYTEELKKMFEQELFLENYINQVNYLYSDNAGKQYAIVSKIDFLEYDFTHEFLYKNYLEMTKYLDDFFKANINVKESLKQKLQDIYCNQVQSTESNEKINKIIFKTVNQAFKQLNNYGNH